MGLGGQRKETSDQPVKDCPHSGEPSSGWSRRLRTTTPLRVEVSELRASAVYFGSNRQGYRKDFSDARTSCRRAAQAYLDLRNEPLPETGGLRASLSSNATAGQDLLHDAGSGRASNLHTVH